MVKYKLPALFDNVDEEVKHDLEECIESVRTHLNNIKIAVRDQYWLQDHSNKRRVEGGLRCLVDKSAEFKNEGKLSEEQADKIRETVAKVRAMMKEILDQF